MDYSMVWILLIVAVALAPLLSALPSKTQRYEARLRDHAMRGGLSVKLDPPPEVPPRFRVDPDLTLVAYRRRRIAPILTLTQPQLVVKSHGCWRSVPAESSMDDAFSGFPAGAHIIVLDAYYVAVYWDEKGGLEAVDAIIVELESLASESSFVSR